MTTQLTGKQRHKLMRLIRAWQWHTGWIDYAWSRVMTWPIAERTESLREWFECDGCADVPLNCTPLSYLEYVEMMSEAGAKFLSRVSQLIAPLSLDVLTKLTSSDLPIGDELRAEFLAFIDYMIWLDAPLTPEEEKAFEILSGAQEKP